MTISEMLVGRTIKEVIEGRIDGHDEAIILVMEDGNRYIIESGSYQGDGGLIVKEMEDTSYNIPKNFEIGLLRD